MWSGSPTPSAPQTETRSIVFLMPQASAVPDTSPLYICSLPIAASFRPNPCPRPNMWASAHSRCPFTTASQRRRWTWSACTFRQRWTKSPRGNSDLCGSGSSAQLRDDADPILRTQRDLRLHLNALPRNQTQTPALRHRRQNQYGLHPREGLANTLPASSTKRKISKPRTLLLLFRGETSRIEFQGIGKIFRAPLDDVLAEENIASGRQPVGAELHVADGLTPHRPGWRIQTHRLRQDHFAIAQIGNIGKLRHPALQDLVQFLMQSALCIRVLCQQQPGPGQRVGDRLISSQKDGQHLVAKL